MDIKHKFAF